MTTSLKVEQLHAIGEMQHSLLAAARELRRVNKLALAHDIPMPACVSLETLRLVSGNLAGLVIEHLRAAPGARREVLARYAAPLAVPLP